MNAVAYRLHGGSSRVPYPRPKPQRRAPLPPLPPGSYDRTIPALYDNPRDLLIYRGNFCGVRVPGVPLLPGMAGFTVPGWHDNAVGGKNPPIMAEDILYYWKVSRDLVVELLSAHASRGHTHLQCSVGNAIDAGMSIDDYIVYSKMVQDIVGFADHWFLPMNIPFPENRDRDGMWWASVCNPWIDALLANRAIDCACVGWQLDQFNTGDTHNGTRPSPIQSIIDYFADRLAPHGIPIGTHWVNEAGAWGEHGRFEWWKAQRNRLTWFHHQGNTDIPIPLYQSKLVDTLQRFGDGTMGTSGLFGDRPFSLIVYECSAQAQFDVVEPHYQTEDQGDLRGTLLCCTRAATQPGGYGNGARRFNGDPL